MANKPRVCRRLFPEEENIGDVRNGRDDGIDELTAMRERDRERWNFDFERGVPLEGRWEWERVSPPSPPPPQDPIDGGIAAPKENGLPIQINEELENDEGMEEDELKAEEEGAGEDKVLFASEGDSDGDEEKVQR